MSKIIVIGNGFDLQAKLESSFDSFFKNHEKVKVENLIGKTSVGNYKNIDDLSFISLLLYNTYYRKPIVLDYGLQRKMVIFNEEYRRRLKIDNSFADWMDVETFLKALLSDKVFKLFKGLYDDVINNKNNYSPICEYDDVKRFIARSIAAARNINTNNYTDYLHAELRVFEREFSKYLSKELEENKMYNENSAIIIKALINGHQSGKILNFNYTSIGSFVGFTEINVHGKINDLPIIGIDNSDLDNDEAISFTKTYRKLIRNDSPNLLTGVFEEIVIYGHSLGKQDYSYFQSIFDYIDLYNSKTIVRLIYSDNFLKTDLEKDVYRNKITKKLFDLITDYSLKLNGENKYKNLLHRLILEGRIKLELRNFISN